MNLPTQAEVNAATRHIGSFVGGVILAFGISTKVDPNTIQQIIAATGTLVNDGIVLIGLVGPMVAAYFASKSANPKSQAESITKTVPGTMIVTPDPKIASTPNPNIVSTNEVKVEKK